MQRVGKIRISLTVWRRPNRINRCSGTTIISDTKNQNERRGPISAKISQVFIDYSNFEMILSNILTC